MTALEKKRDGVKCVSFHYISTFYCGENPLYTLFHNPFYRRLKG